MDLPPTRLSWTFTHLASADAHEVDCHFSCTAQVADQPADKRMFAETFPDQQDKSITARIIAHFDRALRSTLASRVSQCKAADVVGGACPQEWIAALTIAVKPIAFACGIEFLPPFQLELESLSLQRARLEEIARSRAQHRAAGQMQDLQRATELLKQFQAMRQCAPEVSASALLEQLNPADRGQTLQSLLLATSGEKASAPLWTIAGSNLLRIDARANPPRAQSIGISSQLGPFRSVQTGRIEDSTRLLIGAQRGVIVASPDDPSDCRLFTVDTGTSPLGFNRVVATSSAIHASHFELGIITWPLDAPSDPVVQFDPGARHLHWLGGSRVIYSVNNSLVVRDGASRSVFDSHSIAEIIGIVSLSQQIIAIHADGTLVRLDSLSEEVIDVCRRPAQLTAACAMPWLGDARLLLASEQGPIDCIGLEDSITTEYLSPYRGLRAVTATADLIAAVSPDRQRLILWNTWDGQRPIGEAQITAQAKHRVADVRFAGC